MGVTRPDIDLHIEELVLEGFNPGDRHAIGEAVQRELARLLAEKGVPPAMAGGGEIARVDGGQFEQGSGARPEEAGVQTARAVYGGFGK